MDCNQWLVINHVGMYPDICCSVTVSGQRVACAYDETFGDWNLINIYDCDDNQDDTASMWFDIGLLADICTILVGDDEQIDTVNHGCSPSMFAPGALADVAMLLRPRIASYVGL